MCVEREGREARNVLSWRVPNESASRPPSATEGSLASASGRRSAEPPASVASQSTKGSSASATTSSSSSAKARGGGGGGKQQEGRPRGAAATAPSPSAEREEEGEGTRDAIRRRFLSLLFRNLNRAVDELYWVCEAESSHDQSLEAARLLESCARDFHKVGRCA